MYVLNPPPPQPPTFQDFYNSGLKGKSGWLRPWKWQDPPFYSLDFDLNISFQAQKLPGLSRNAPLFQISESGTNIHGILWRFCYWPNQNTSNSGLELGRDRTVTLSRNTMKWLRGGLANAHTHTHRKKTKQKQGFLALFQRGELVQFVQSGFFLVISCTIHGKCIRNSCSVASIWDKIQANQHSPKINTVASSLLSFPSQRYFKPRHYWPGEFLWYKHLILLKINIFSRYSRTSRKRPPKMRRISGRWREMVAHGGSTAGLNLGDKLFSVTSSSPAFKVKSCKFCNTRQHLRTRKIVSKINKKQNAKQNDRGVQNNDIPCVASASAQVCSTFSTQKRLLHRLRPRNP